MTPPLADVLLAKSNPAARELLAQTADLEQQLVGVLANARAKWSTVSAGDEQVVAYIAERIPEGIDDTWSLDELHTSDLYVACAAVGGSDAAIAAIEARYFGDLTAALIHAGASRPVAEEVQQALLVKLFVGSDDREARIATYSGRGDLYSWIRVTAVRMLATAMRKRGKEQTFNSAVAEHLEANDPAAAELRERYHAEFKAAIAAALTTLSSRERNLLRHQVLDRMSIDQVGALYDVHRATAARWLHKARQTLGEITRTELSNRLDADADELNSILRLIDSQLEASLPRLLGHHSNEN